MTATHREDAQMSTPTATMPRLTEGVQFKDHNGYLKAAIVTGNQQSIRNDGSAKDGVPAIESPDELHLAVFSPNGSMEVRHNIRRGTGPGQWAPLTG